jgi:hypothetical protein
MSQCAGRGVNPAFTLRDPTLECGGSTPLWPMAFAFLFRTGRERQE